MIVFKLRYSLSTRMSISTVWNNVIRIANKAAVVGGVVKAVLPYRTRPIDLGHTAGGPINRGVEVTSEVADSHQSIILQQVENGVAIRMAVLFLLAQSQLNKNIH